MSKISFQPEKIPLDGSYQMPFGKHKSEAVEDISSWYLAYIVREVEHPLAVAAAKAELEYRDKHNAHFDNEGAFVELTVREIDAIALDESYHDYENEP